MTADPVLEWVPVRGGSLRVARWGDAGPVVVAAHGITSSHRFWSLVGPAVAESGALTLLAPDLRGRGDSAGLPGPWSIAGHAEDLLAVADHARAQRVVALGHSMGAFVAAVFAAAHPDRVTALVLVDGGPPLTGPLPADADVDAVLHAVIGPSLERLHARFPSREDYREFWRRHPSFADVPPAQVDAYADHDLAGEPPDLRSKVSIDAVRADARDTLFNADVLAAFTRAVSPKVLLYAERGMVDQPTGLYSAEVVARLGRQVPDLRTELVAGTNHFTIGMSHRGAAVVARHLLATRRLG